MGRRAALEERAKALPVASGCHSACGSGQSGSVRATGHEVINELRCWIGTAA